MRFREIIAEAENEDSDVFDIIVFFQEGGKHILKNVPKSFVELGNLEEKLRGIVRRNFNKIMSRFEIGGEGTDQSKKDSEKPSDNSPEIPVSKQDTEKDTVKKPDTVKAPADKNDSELEPQIDVGPITPVDNPDSSDSEPTTTDTGTQEPYPEVELELYYNDPESDTAMTYADLKQKYGEKRANEITGRSGGSEGERGKEGVEGEEGALTGNQRAAIPSIIQELRRSISGLGTNETRMINALKRIESAEHLKAVVEMYNTEYNSNLADDIIGEYNYEGSEADRTVTEINEIMRPLGWKIVGKSILGTLRWREHKG